MSIRKILVPTDFSVCAKRASDIATTIARKINSELIFVHFFPDPEIVMHKNVKPDKAWTDADAEIARVKSNLDLLVRETEHQGVPAKAVLIYDKGNETIEDYAESYQADLIVMGTRGTKGMIEWLGVGTNTQRVSRNSNVPVLAIKGDCRNLEVKNILFASAFDENVVAPMLFITGLAEFYHATIHLLYVSTAIQPTERAYAEAKMQELVEKFPDTSFTLNFADTNDEEVAISRKAKALGIDMIALTPHDRDGLLWYFSHSIAENLVNHDEHPILVIPEQ